MNPEAEEEEMTELEKAVDETPDLRPRTKELYLRCVRTFVEFTGTSSEQWTEEALTKWRNSMRRRGMEPQSVNAALFAVRFAARRLKTPSFAEETKMLRVGEKGAGRTLSYSEAGALLRACAGPQARDLRDTAICVLGLRTGMLRFSMCQLRFQDLKDKGTKLTFIRKGGKPYTIALDEPTQAALRIWTTWLQKQDVTSGPLFRSLSRRLQETPHVGEGLTPDGLYRAIQQRAAKADLGNLSPLIFRRTFLAWAEKVHAQPYEIAFVTGYRSDGPEPPKGVVCNAINIRDSIGPVKDA